MLSDDGDKAAAADSVDSADSVDAPDNNSQARAPQRSARGEVTPAELALVVTPYDVKRLKSYAKNLVDYHMIVDLVPSLARLFFLQRFPRLTLSFLQRAILVRIGLQHQSVDAVQKELGVPANQLLALFNKAVRKFLTQLEAVAEQQLAAEQQAQDARTAALAGATRDMRPTAQSLADEMRDGASAGKQQLLQREMLEGLNLAKYAVRGEDADWDAALASSAKAEGGAAAVVQVKSKKKLKREAPASDKAAATGAVAAAGKKAHKKAKYANLKK
ncbi:hypothetical protein PybrP1_005567 [[Pythium] brassicae (nom. inval.)]|nr:hypothetical protein PybrP1_005567 [[Pythium] brassicae (nom. inval.)]